ncbi:MAG TPA: hypothetical protein VN317_02815, partial [Candidatus Methanoperedens sp.]|nr:hypothetical protein [Candidatus Methanoperedens sp.]
AVDAEAGWCPSQADARRATPQMAPYQRTKMAGRSDGVRCKALDAVDAEAGWCPSQADARRATPQMAPYQRPA